MVLVSELVRIRTSIRRSLNVPSASELVLAKSATEVEKRQMPLQRTSAISCRISLLDSWNAQESGNENNNLTGLTPQSLVVS